ncbi:MAG: TIGR04076 family protein [Bacillota bacterium]
MYRLRVIVEEIKGFCDLPMRVGDYFEVDGGSLLVPPGQRVCIWALQSLIPFLTAKQRNIVDDNDWVPTTSKISCPDPNGVVIYKVIRVGVDDAAGGSGAVPGRAGDAEANGAIPQRILVNAAACSGCRRCELACSMNHEGQFSPEMSRIVVDKDDACGTDSPRVCRQCGIAKCLQACPAGAIARDPDTRAVIVDRSRCRKCGACIRACPFGAIRMTSEGFPLICDLCGGSPACADACPTGAVTFGRAGDTVPEPRFRQPGKEPVS